MLVLFGAREQVIAARSRRRSRRRSRCRLGLSSGVPALPSRFRGSAWVGLAIDLGRAFRRHTSAALDRHVVRNSSSSHQHNAVEVDWTPVVAVYFEGKPLFVAGCVHHQSTPVTDELDNTLPDVLSHTGRNMADEHPRADLQ